MDNTKQTPYAQKLSYELLVILLIGFFIYIGHGVLVPIYFAILLSILLLPVTNFLTKWYVPATLANLLSVILAFGIIGGIIYFLSSQVAGFFNDIPSIREHLAEHITSLQAWAEESFHISSEQQRAFLESAKEGIRHSGGQYIGQTFLTLSGTVVLTVMICIYAFLILCYRSLIKRFLFSVFSSQHAESLRYVLIESKQIIQHYMTGLLIEMAIVAICYSAALLIIGVKYAVFLGIFAAVLNIVPYIGLFTGILFTVLVTMSNSSGMHDILWIIIAMEAIHFCDANF